MAMDFIPCWLAKQTGEHSVQVLTKAEWTSIQSIIQCAALVYSSRGAETRGSAFCYTSVTLAMKPFAHWRYAPPTRSNLSLWLLQSLVTMGLTFTKTQWICVTRTYQSIHRITWSFHQQAHRAHRLTIPRKTQWKFRRGARSPGMRHPQTHSRAHAQLKGTITGLSFVLNVCNLWWGFKKKKNRIPGNKEMFQSLIKSTRPLICIYMRVCVCIYIYICIISNILLNAQVWWRVVLIFWIIWGKKSIRTL